MSKRQTLTSEVRSDQILSAAIDVARRDGWEAVTRDNVAEEADCAVGTINNMFGVMYNLKKAVIAKACEMVEAGDHDVNLVTVVAKGLASGDAGARNATTNVKELAFKLMAGM